jgi:hypothetical protein
VVAVGWAESFNTDADKEYYIGGKRAASCFSVFPQAWILRLSAFCGQAHFIGWKVPRSGESGRAMYAENPARHFMIFVSAIVEMVRGICYNSFCIARKR